MASPLKPLSVLAVLILVLASAAHAQPDPPLDTFIQQKIVQQDVRLGDNEEAAAYLRALDPGELRVARNALFAKHGYVFDDSTLQAYFDKQSWYEAQDKDVSLSSTEENNVKFIQSLEDRAQSQLDAFYAKFPPCNFPVHVRLVERDGPVAPAGYSTDDQTASVPGSGEQLDSLSVEVVLGDDRFGLHRAGCTITQTDRYRVLLYVQDTAAGGGGSHYKTAIFDAAGWRRSKRTLLDFIASLDHTERGELTISRDDEILIQTKQIQTESRRIRGKQRKTRQVKTWRWFTIAPDGTLKALHENR